MRISKCVAFVVKRLTDFPSWRCIPQPLKRCSGFYMCGFKVGKGDKVKLGIGGTLREK